MLLARWSQISSTSEKRAFECPKCSFVQTLIADDPLKSDPLRWLSAELGQRE
jgi:hypothetical protein